MSGYVKLFGSILDSTVWDTPPAVRCVWITLLAMADRDGVVEASVPGLAKRAGVERGDCERALALFSSPDPDSRSRDHDGRRIVEVDGGWQLLNYEKYRDRASKDEAAKKNAERQARWRARNFSNGKSRKVTPVTQSNHTADPPPPAEAAADPDQTRARDPGRAEAEEAPELDPPEPDELAEPYAGLDGAEVSRAWTAVTGQVLTGHREALTAFRSIAETLTRLVGDDARTAAWAYVRWVFEAPNGPARRAENPMKRIRPWSLLAGVADDLPLARAWFNGLDDAEQRRASPPRSLGAEASA